MELLSFMKGLPIPLLIILVLFLLITTAYMAYQYAKEKGLQGIREKVYKLFLRAEHRFKESESGKQKMKWVCYQARELLPDWLKFFITDEMLENIIQTWFNGIKDLLDDGKLNNIM